MNFIDEIDSEIFEEFAYEYEDELDEIDVDELIAKLKTDISDYIYENPLDEVPDIGSDSIDYDFVDEYLIPDEELERLEPKDDFLDYVGK